jgi:hypothetical protein
VVDGELVVARRDATGVLLFRLKAVNASCCSRFDADCTRELTAKQRAWALDPVEEPFNRLRAR